MLRPEPDVTRAATASRRLDDTFRTYLAERGPKKMGLPAVTTLLTGASMLRLAGDAILTLWRDAPDHTPGTSEAARVLLTRTRALAAWYDRLAVTLVRSDTPAPEPDPPSIAIHDLLLSIVERDSRSADGAAFAGVGVARTAEHLDAVRRLEALVARQVGDARSDRARSKPGRPWDRTASRPPLRRQERQNEV